MKLLVSLPLLAGSATGLSLLERYKKAKKGYSWRSSLTPTGTAFDTAPDACCACFKSRKAMPDNGGFKGTFVASELPGKCFVSDKYEIEGKDGGTMSIDDAWLKIKAEGVAVHEWNWNLGNGVSPEDPNEWLAGPVEGEPGARTAFHMCLEKPGFYCAGTSGPSLEKGEGDEAEIKEVDAVDGKGSEVTLFHLPKINADAADVEKPHKEVAPPPVDPEAEPAAAVEEFKPDLTGIDMGNCEKKFGLQMLTSENVGDFLGPASWVTIGHDCLGGGVKERGDGKFTITIAHCFKGFDTWKTAVPHVDFSKLEEDGDNGFAGTPEEWAAAGLGKSEVFAPPPKEVRREIMKYWQERGVFK